MPSGLRRAQRLALPAVVTGTLVSAAIAVPAMAPASADQGDVVLTESFDGPGLPDGWNPVVGDWTVQDGRLVGGTAGIGRITFGPHLENYRIEATMRFESVNNSSRWAGVILDISSDGSVPS